MNPPPVADLATLSRLVTERIGLSFPPERSEDFAKGIERAARIFGFNETAACVDWLMSGRLDASQTEVLAGCLAVGETYFLRDPPIIHHFKTQVLPTLIDARAGRSRRLDLWSAGCCTGEEAYTLAICIAEAIPERSKWCVDILGSDINPVFLEKARRAVFGNWSFRDVPPDFRVRYFTKMEAGGWQLQPAIRRMVRFASGNLVDIQPPKGEHRMDVIFCRNVLMYFPPDLVSRVVHSLQRWLAPEGWLIVAPSEVSLIAHRDLTPVRFDGATFFRNGQTDTARVAPPPVLPAAGALPDVAPVPVSPPPVADLTAAAPVAQAPDAFEQACEDLAQGRYAEALDRLSGARFMRASEAAVLALSARAHANLGQLDEALRCCDRLVAVDKMEPAHHYLRACILQARHDLRQAAAAFDRILYLDPAFVLAHLGLGHIARQRGLPEAAARHFRNALAAMVDHPDDAVIPESGGLTAADLTATLSRLLEDKASV